MGRLFRAGHALEVPVIEDDGVDRPANRVRSSSTSSMWRRLAPPVDSAARGLICSGCTSLRERPRYLCPRSGTRSYQGDADQFPTVLADARDRAHSTLRWSSARWPRATISGPDFSAADISCTSRSPPPCTGYPRRPLSQPADIPVPPGIPPGFPACRRRLMQGNSAWKLIRVTSVNESGRSGVCVQQFRGVNLKYLRETSCPTLQTRSAAWMRRRRRPAASNQN